MKILFAIVNYKTTILARSLIESVKDSLRLCESKQLGVEVALEVYFNHIPNECELELLDSIQLPRELTLEKITDGLNSGYFGRLPAVQASAQSRSADLVIFANSDLQLDLDFFENLVAAHRQAPANCAVFAPAILSKSTGNDSGLNYVERVSTSKLKKLALIFKWRCSYVAYSGLNLIKSKIKGGLLRNKPNGGRGSQKVFAPHGALIVFRSLDFFLKIPSYPVFLFGEEIFLGDQLIKFGYTAWYMPDLLVYDVQHASISKIPSDTVRIWHLESLRALIKIRSSA
ncbi:hypothetical protein WG899_21585 [Paucibacter sp. AS339]|uniref:hypothetical protein n=1 Tax=Paucibacter hankyongi TaxID=3133434 RepID=UPI0030A59B16